MSSIFFRCDKAGSCEDRVTVGRLVQHVEAANRLHGAGLVLHHYLPAFGVTEFARDDPTDDIRRSTGRGWYYNPRSSGTFRRLPATAWQRRPPGQKGNPNAGKSR